MDSKNEDEPLPYKKEIHDMTLEYYSEQCGQRINTIEELSDVLRINLAIGHDLIDKKKYIWSFMRWHKVDGSPKKAVDTCDKEEFRILYTKLRCLNGYAVHYETATDLVSGSRMREIQSNISSCYTVCKWPWAVELSLIERIPCD